MSKKPIIFLAFANDRVDEASYLRNLPQELNGIRAALEQAVKEGLCEVIERANATIDIILDVFQDSRYRDRIAIFHYGGHANGYQLLLENLDGSHAVAHSGGLVGFLANQIGLQLVFLNGCSSQQQALDLVQAGLPAVIGTSQSINDDVATMLSLRFYQALGNGANLSRAWTEAIDQVKIQKGTANMRDLLWEGAGSETAIDRFPWDMHYGEGADLVKGWNLPESSENPLFGLPEPTSQVDLPQEPYRFLQRYTKDHAPIFFGRSYAIRDLYNSAVDVSAAPIILFYGQSGVGKSSMLDAGLLPRLERTRQVVYIRRNPEKGLLGTLKEALGFEDNGERLRSQQQTQEEANLQQRIQQLTWVASQSEQAEKEAIEQIIHQLEEKLKAKEEAITKEAAAIIQAENQRDAWKALEEKFNRPLIVLLDQVEEAYTHPNTEMPTEMDDFWDEVKAVFGNPKQRPQGKLILSYRKEYNPEVKEACTVRHLPKEEVFLKALTRKDIIEVVQGLTLSVRTQRAYQLQVEKELPVIIADDLLEDRESPIAPVLQILLTKLWKMTEGEESRVFSIERYQLLRKQGILMDDFFYEQMEQLEQVFPEAVDSGLALGLLQLHITKAGTASRRSIDALRELYMDRQEVIEQLLSKLKDLYLLSSSSNHATSLAHDTLAPLVLKEYRNSNRAAQRGSIILDSKLPAYLRDPNNLIDANDLQIIEQGIYGMPLFTAQERELVEASKKRRDKERADKKRIRQLGIVATVLIMITAIFAFIQKNNAEKQQVNAQRQTKIAEDALHEIREKNFQIYEGLHESVLESINREDYERAYTDFKQSLFLGVEQDTAQQTLQKLANEVWGRAQVMPVAFLTDLAVEMANLGLSVDKELLNSTATCIALHQQPKASELLLFYRTLAKPEWLTANDSLVQSLAASLCDTITSDSKMALQQLATLSGNPALTDILFVKIDSGTFTLGCQEGDPDCGTDEKPALPEVYVPSFYMSKFEVTQAEYEALMGENPSNFKDCPTCPVETIDWYDAIRYCNKLSERDSLPAYYEIKSERDRYYYPLVNIPDSEGAGYRLPNEDEWEYAAKALGKSNAIYSGGDTLSNYGWYAANSSSRTHGVGSKSPNELGIYDLNGNVWEWCGDWYNSEYDLVMTGDKKILNYNAFSAKNRSIRGGGWRSEGRRARNSERYWNTPNSYRLYGLNDHGIGLRLTRNASTVSP